VPSASGQQVILYYCLSNVDFIKVEKDLMDIDLPFLLLKSNALSISS
jgi:hypothetical protein